MNLKAIFNEFKSQVAFVLLLIWLLAFIVHFRTLNYLLYPMFAVGLMTALDLGITWIRSRKLYWPSASFVTGALIGLILDPGSLLAIGLACFLASVCKQFINSGIRQHIFNPAAFGILAASLILGLPVSWWAVSWSRYPLFILVPAAIWILFRMGRIWIPITFLLTYLAYNLTIFPLQFAITSLADGSLLLFAMVMLPEPITTPATGAFKYLFGAAVGLIVIGLSELWTFSEVLLPTLLVANLGGFLIRKFNMRLSKSPEAKSS